MRPNLYDAAPDFLPVTEAPPKAIRYEECPHCHHEVMARSDGKCIACGKSRLDTAGVDPSKTMLTIDNVHKLPACCFLCGTDTQRMQRFTWNYRIDPYSLPPWMAPFVRLLSFVPGSQYRSSERMRLPVCPHCARAARRVQPQSVWSGLDCRILVHREFRTRFEAINGKTRLEWEAEARTAVPGASKPPPLMGIGARL